MTYDEQLRTPEWKALAKKIKDRDGHMCRVCRSTKDLDVHHNAYISGRMAWEYDESYLITLCDTHHKIFHELPVEKDVSEYRGVPYESDWSRDKWLQIRRDLQALSGLNQQIIRKEIESEYHKKHSDG